MKLFLIIFFIALPYYSFSQGFKIRVAGSEFPTDKIPGHVNFPSRVNTFSIKKEAKNSLSNTYIVQIGEEEHSFSTDGAYHNVEFTHDIRDLVVYILNDKRDVQGKPFILKKPK